MQLIAACRLLLSLSVKYNFSLSSYNLALSSASSDLSTYTRKKKGGGGAWDTTSRELGHPIQTIELYITVTTKSIG